MTKTEPTVLICPQKSICFIDFLTSNAWNYGYQVHLKVGILWPMRPQKVTDWQWKDNWKHKEMGTWKMNWTSLNLVGKCVLAQSQPLIMHLNPRVSHLFHGDHICPNNPPMRRFEMYEVVSKHQALLLLTKVKERVSDLARSGIVWTQGLCANTRLLFITNYEYSLKTRRINTTAILRD